MHLFVDSIHYITHHAHTYAHVLAPGRKNYLFTQWTNQHASIDSIHYFTLTTLTRMHTLAAKLCAIISRITCHKILTYDSLHHAHSYAHARGKTLRDYFQNNMPQNTIFETKHHLIGYSSYTPFCFLTHAKGTTPQNPFLSGGFVFLYTGEVSSGEVVFNAVERIWANIEGSPMAPPA